MESEILRGVIPRVELQRIHLDFLRNNKHVKTVMLDVDSAERLIGKDDVLNSIFKNFQLITTSTIHDSKLEQWVLGREVRVVRKIKPKYHVPCDYPVYISDPPKLRINIIKNYVGEVKQFLNLTRDVETEVIPLVKGITSQERHICYSNFKRFNLHIWGYYCSQYFGGYVGNRAGELVEDLMTIISESNPKSLILIGFQSSKYLSFLPPQITAVAGQRWIRKSGLRTVTIEKAQENYGRWKQTAEKSLNGGYVPLFFFNESNKGDGNGN